MSIFKLNVSQKTCSESRTASWHLKRARRSPKVNYVLISIYYRLKIARFKETLAVTQAPLRGALVGWRTMRLNEACIRGT